MKRAEIIVKGKVQRVGYRDTVEDIARDMNIIGYVENLKPHDVRIVCEADKEHLDEFIDQIQLKDYPIFVQSVDVRFDDPTEEFEYFEIKRGDWQDELGERMDVASRMMYGINKNTTQSVDIGKQMLDKQDQMLGKQDQMLDKQDLMLGKQDQMLDKQDTTIGSIEGLRGDMGKRFDTLDDKYGAISKNLVAIIEKIEILLEKSDRDREAYQKNMDRLMNALIDALNRGNLVTR